MKKKWLCLLTALALIVGTCVAEPIISGAEEALNLQQKCSMTIYPENPNVVSEQQLYADDWANADIVVDLYKVAEAAKTPGYDTYSYKLTPAYEGLTIPGRTDEQTNAADWQKLAQAAGKRALGLDEKKTVATPAKTTVKMAGIGGVEIEDLEPGLYLLIARSSDMKTVADYKVTMKSEDPAAEINGTIATIADSPTYTYIFSPELVSVPMRGTADSLDVAYNPAGDAPQWTSDGNQWVYDLNVNLKPMRVRRYGALAIEKELEIYESEEDVPDVTTKPAGQDEKVTFVFRASWNDPDTNAAESRVDSITFDSTSGRSKRIVVERIPVGATVTVEEIYEGASYKLKDGETRKKTVTAGVGAERIQNGILLLYQDGKPNTIIGDVVNAGTASRQIPSISFTNTYNGRQRKGFGINNKFVYKDGEGWYWIQDDDGTKTGTLVSSSTSTPTVSENE